MSFTIIDAEQRSPEWFAARAGRLTGSVAGEMLAKNKDGRWSASRRNLCLRLMLERLTKRPQEDDYQSPAMLAGLEREAAARAAYEALTGNVVLVSGFLSHNEHWAGCSLDGHMGDFERLMSIKCRQPNAHLEFLRTGKIPADALAQMRHELWIAGALKHDYFSWNPDFPEALQARIVTVKAADVDIPGYEREALAFLAEVETEVQAVKTMVDMKAVLREAVA